MSQPVRPSRTAVTVDEPDVRQFFEALRPRPGREVLTAAEVFQAPEKR